MSSRDTGGGGRFRLPAASLLFTFMTRNSTEDAMTEASTREEHPDFSLVLGAVPSVKLKVREAS